MAKNEVRTLSVILNEVEKKVEAYNELPEIDPKRAKMTVETKALVNEYNELSWLTVFSKCMEAELPLKAFVETFEYNTIGIKDAPRPKILEDGSKTEVYSRSVTEKPKMLDLVKFIDWAADGNKQVAHEKDWRKKILAAKQAIKTEWKKYLASKGDSHSVSNKKMKTALQEMFNSLIFIPTEKGENSVIASNDIAKYAFAFANKLNPSVDKDASDGDLLPESNWKVVQMKALRDAVAGKKLVIDMKENEDEDAEAKEKAKSESAK